jgi:hypothetical protein
MDNTTPTYEFNKTYTHVIENYGFDILNIEEVNNKYKDGRVFSHFIELWLAKMFTLKHINGCKDHDFTDINNLEIQYDQKTFTKGGCRFCPSNMIGVGRVFDKQKFEEKANKLIYIIVSNINFPEIKIKFVKGSDLIIKYPKGEIKLKDSVEFFN